MSAQESPPPPPDTFPGGPAPPPPPTVSSDAPPHAPPPTKPEPESEAASLLSTLSSCELKVLSLLSVTSSTCSLLSRLSSPPPPSSTCTTPSTTAALVAELQSNSLSFTGILREVYSSLAPLHGHVKTYAGRRTVAKEEGGGGGGVIEGMMGAGGGRWEEDGEAERLKRAVLEREGTTYWKWEEERLACEKKELLEMKGRLEREWYGEGGEEGKKKEGGGISTETETGGKRKR